MDARRRKKVSLKALKWWQDYLKMRPKAALIKSLSKAYFDVFKTVTQSLQCCLALFHALLDAPACKALSTTILNLF